MYDNQLKILLDNNRWEEAINYIDSIDESLLDIDLLSKLAWSCSRAEKYKRAIVLYDKLIKSDPNSAKWYYAKGYQYYMQKDWKNAIENFSLALQKYDKYFKVKYRIAYAYIQISGNNQQWSQDSFWKAINHLEDCHRIYQSYDSEDKKTNASTYASICALHAKAIMSSDKYIGKSIELLLTANSLKDNDDYKYELAKAYYKNNQYIEALNILPKKNRPYYILELRSSILAEMGNYSESNIVLHKLLSYRKKDYLFRRLSENYLSMNIYDEAIIFAKKAIELDRNNYKNYLTYGNILNKQNNYKSAVECFENARQLKQQKYNSDCVEAIRFIDEINEITNNNPTDNLNNTGVCHRGCVINFNNKKGYGFIKDNALKNNVFFHKSEFKDKCNIRKGIIVDYEIISKEKGYSAINIKIAQPETFERLKSESLA